MVKSRSPEDSARRRLRGIVLAFLEGEMTQKWVIGSFKKIPLSQFDDLVDEAKRIYPRPPRIPVLDLIRAKLQGSRKFNNK